MPFKKIGLCDELVQGILATGYTAPTEIQAEAIPIAIAGRDMIGCAQTGTGKTAAFVLPILNRIANNPTMGKKRVIRALIITPTRELAMQIDNSVKGYGRFMKLKSLAVYGGSAMDKQIRTLRSGIDIMAATPGRLIDHINRGTVSLSNVEVLVLDEADRMLDMGFIEDITTISQKLSKSRQTLLFSATMSKQVVKLTKNLQKNPKILQIGKQHNPIETITQHIYPVGSDQKMDLLLFMLKRQQMYSVLIFSKTKRGADKICRRLKQNDIKAESIHSDRTQRQRIKAIEGFKSGKFNVMVATDVAARGINIEGISHVFNYDVPAYAEDYVHRIGRTGRAEATGDAITFVSYDEIPYIRKIERFIDQRFKEEYYDGFEYKQRLTLKNGPTAASSGGRKRVGSSQRKRATAKRTGQGGGGPSKQGRGGFTGRKSAGVGKAERSGTGTRNSRGPAKREDTRSKKKTTSPGYKGAPKPRTKSAEGKTTRKKKSGPPKSAGATNSKKRNPVGATSKKSFKRKPQKSSGGTVKTSSFKRSKKR
jgi:ATP-dependent RNA helicase RhlE